MKHLNFKVCLIILAAVLLFTACSMGDRKNEHTHLSSVNKASLQAESPLPDTSNIIFRTSFLGCGDVIIYGGNIKDARSKAINGGREYNFKPQFEKVADVINSADIAFVNQETLMCGEGFDISYYPMFNSPQDLGHDLVELGFDVVNIANNHMLDKGAAGLSKTIEFWKSMDTLMIGGYENKEDFDNIRFLEKEGIKIAFLSYTYGTNGLSKPKSSELVIPYLDDDDIIRQTALAKECSDFVMVSVHWGYEGAFKPNSEQIRIAQLFADCGVDAIIGHHPHVIQPVEWLTGKNGNKTLCVFSLGNFMAEQAYDYNMVGGMISFDIVHSGVKQPYIDNVLFTPTVFHFPANFYTNIIYPMSEYTPSLAAVHGVKNYYKHSLSYDGLIKFATDTIDKEFLPEFLHEQMAE